MPQRNSPKNINSLEDLKDLDHLIVDKRNHKRSDAKKNRRDRHYQKQFIKNTITDYTLINSENIDDLAVTEENKT